MRRLLTGLIALSWAAASSASQDSPHVTAAGLYRHGEAHAARAALSVLSEKATRLSIDQFVEVGPSSVDVAAAVLVHAELVQTAPGAERGKMHVDAATKLLEPLEKDPEAKRFVDRVGGDETS